MNAGCELCLQPGGRTLYADGKLRVVAVEEQDYPGYLRVVWNAHVRELTDLDDDDRAYLLRVLCAVEAAQRRVALSAARPAAATSGRGAGLARRCRSLPRGS